MKSRNLLLPAIIAIGAASSAQAQILTNLDPTQSYLAVTGPPAPGTGGLCGAGFCVSATQGIPLSYYATASNVSGQFTTLTGQTNSLAAQVNSLTTQMNRRTARVREGVAVGASMGDAIPNPGDRFAVRFNTGGFVNEAAGSVSFSYAFADNARVSLNYGQGRTQSIVSGGVTLSFR